MYGDGPVLSGNFEKALLDDCIDASDCLFRHSVCVNGKCECLSGYKMTMERKICILQNEVLKIKSFK